MGAGGPIVFAISLLLHFFVTAQIYRRTRQPRQRRRGRQGPRRRRTWTGFHRHTRIYAHAHTHIYTHTLTHDLPRPSLCGARRIAVFANVTFGCGPPSSLRNSQLALKPTHRKIQELTKKGALLPPQLPISYSTQPDPQKDPRVDEERNPPPSATPNWHSNRPTERSKS